MTACGGTGQATSCARGAEAEALLHDPAFCAAWRDLQADCPWATAFQSLDFVQTWYRSYAAVHEPVLLFARAPGGRLAGLLALAAPRDGSDWLVAGGPQAEYQTWLARNGSEFIADALALLFRSASVERLTFLYLPARAPLDWTAQEAWRDRVRRVAWQRPLMAVDDAEALGRSLAKKGNKSRLKRLKRLGELRLETVTDQGRLAQVVDRFVTLCDFRHGAVHRVLPFHADRRMADFYLALMATPGLLDVSLLWAGERLVAAHMGLRDRTFLYNGMLTHSPFEARQSPGKLHLLMLARRLAEEGFGFFDLTPGGDPWKDRFASVQETVGELVIHRRARSCRLEACRLAGKSWLAALIRAAGADPSELRRRAGELWHGGPAGLVAGFVPQAGTRSFDLRGPFDPDTTDLALDRLAHLIAYAARDDRVRRSDFLARALNRIEGGQSFCTAVSKGQMIFLAWIGVAQGTEPGATVEVETCDPAAAGYVAAAVGRAAALRGTERVTLALPAALAGAESSLRDLMSGAVPRPLEAVG